MTDSGRHWAFHLLWQIPLLAIFCFLSSNLNSNLSQQFSSFMPETVVNCSTLNPQASGYRALYELAQRSGLSCERFDKSYRELGAYRGALLVVAPNYLMHGYDVDRILSWVARGNKLIYLDYCLFGSARPLLSQLGVSSNYDLPLENWTPKKLPELAELEHVNQLVLNAESRLQGGTVMLEDEKGKALMVRVNHGKGTCIIAVLPGLCANRKISDNRNWGNFQFLINLLQNPAGRVIFDERVHGYSNAQNAFIYLARGPAGLIVLQMLIIFFIAAFSLNQRFGPLKLVQAKRRIAATEYVDGMAHTYLKAKANDTALAILFGSFRNRLCKALSLAPSEPAEKIAEQWAHSTPLKYEELLQFLLKAEKLENSRATNEDELLNVMKDCDRLYEASKPYLAVQPGRRLGG